MQTIIYYSFKPRAINHTTRKP